MLTHKDRTILGAIPTDWDVFLLRNALDDSKSYSGDWGDDSGDVACRILRSTNISNDGQLSLDNAATRWFTEKKAAEFDLKAGDLLLERSGGGPDQPVGRVVFVEADLPGYGFGNFIHRLRVKADHVHPKYLYYCLYELHRSGIVERLQFQTTQMRNLDYRDYARVYLPRPGIDEQESILKLLDESDSLLQLAKEGLGITASLHRDQMQGPISRLKVNLLRALITGRVRAVK